MATYKLAELADRLGATLIGDQQAEIHGVAPLHLAEEGEASFVKSAAFLKQLSTTAASAVLLHSDWQGDCPTNALVCENPELASIELMTCFSERPRFYPGIHPTAVIAESAQLSDGVHVGAFCEIGDHVKIAAGAVIGSHVSIGAHTEIGKNSHLYSGVRCYDGVLIGDDVVVHSGAVIGADGFGLAAEKTGEWRSIPQIGGVKIGSDVVIGANTCIDRGALGDTVIETGVKLDNHIQIGHNVLIGAHTAIAACCGIAGSAVIGRHCVLAGMVGVADHVEIADHVVVTGQSGVTRNIAQSGVYSSSLSALPVARWRRIVGRLSYLDDIVKRVNLLMKGSKCDG